MKKALAILFLFLTSVALATHPVLSQTAGDLITDLQHQIEELEAKVNELAEKKTTLAAEISYMDGQIKITSLKISQTEEEIKMLTEKIGRLEVSLDYLANLLNRRIVETYKKADIDALALFFSSGRFSDFVARYKYLKVIQANDRKLIYAMETTRTNYDDQRKEEEALKEKLEKQQTLLARQKKDKEYLLTVTENDEKRYQALLAEAKREIQALLASKFTEKRHVEKGEVIGLMGNTGFSTGPHLHFGVYDLREENVGDFDYYHDQNPLSYLASKTVLFRGTSCDDIPEDETRTVGSGSKSWPMADPEITQCYGHTPWSWMYSDNFHHGLDMADTDDIFIRSVEEGEAYFYRGQTSFGNNVRIFHPDGKMTLYLHLQ